MLAFEEPSNPLLLLSSGLLFAPVAAAFVHLYVTRELTQEQRRTWFKELTVRRALWAVGEYLSCEDLTAAETKFTEQCPCQNPQRDST